MKKEREREGEIETPGGGERGREGEKSTLT